MKRDDIWLALGDPAGEERERISVIWRFRDLCDSARVDPAVWRAGPDLLRVYADIGLTALPLEGGNGVPAVSVSDQCMGRRLFSSFLPRLFMPISSP